ncbi:MAG: hypothetical protein IT373_16835 [Polyangiaceae bacterium]|nr:hypothetical protein [Polyangiaceae bacterium]
MARLTGTSEARRLRARRGLVALASLAALGLGAAGCDESPVPIACQRPVTAEPTDVLIGTLDNDVYMSADWYGEWLYFPGGAFFRFHHGLGAMPRWWIPYLSFGRHALTDGSEVSIGAGDVAQVAAVDDYTITVMNGTCADFYLMMVVGL